MLMPQRLLPLLIALAAAHAQAATPPLQTIAVAPLASADADHAWVGVAVADIVNDGLAQKTGVGAFTTRQLAAALQQAEVTLAQLSDPDRAQRLARHLGAQFVLVGDFSVHGARLRGEVRLIDARSGEILKSQPLAGEVGDLAALTAAVAKTLQATIGYPAAQAIGRLPDGATPIAIETTTRALMQLRGQSLSPRAANPLVALALTPRQLADLDAALAPVVAATPTYAPAWVALGLTRAMAGDQAAALQCLDQAAQLGASAPATTPLVRAFVQMRAGQFDQAESVLRATVAAHPTFLHARGTLAQLLLHFGRLREAGAMFEQYLALVPEQPWVRAQLGYCHAKRGKHQQAIAETQRAVALMPSSTYLLTELAGRQIDADDFDGARTTLQQVIKASPEDVRAHVRLAYVELRRGEDDAVLELSRKALKLADGARYSRDRAYAHLNIARALGHRGQLDAAIAHLQEARAAADVPLAEVDSDTQLDQLRQDPRYLKLLETAP